MSLVPVTTFSERLKEALGDCSATEFAKKIGVSKQTISAYLTGVRKPKRPSLKVIAEALGVNEAWLLGYNTPKSRNDYFVPLSDMPHFLAESIKRWDKGDFIAFLNSFMSADEVSLLLDYKELNNQGREFITQTMHVALNTYKKCEDSALNDTVCMFRAAQSEDNTESVVDNMPRSTYDKLKSGKAVTKEEDI